MLRPFIVNSKDAYLWLPQTADVADARARICRNHITMLKYSIYLTLVHFHFEKTYSQKQHTPWATAQKNPRSDAKIHNRGLMDKSTNFTADYGCYAG